MYLSHVGLDRLFECRNISNNHDLIYMYLIHFVLEIKNCHKIIQSCLILTFGAQLQIVFKSFSTNFQTFQCSNKKFRRGYKIVSSARWTKGQGDSNIPPIFCLQEFNTIHTHAYIFRFLPFADFLRTSFRVLIISEGSLPIFGAQRNKITSTIGPSLVFVFINV